MKRTGFTLIELLVVVLIISILAVIALPQYQKAVEKTRAAEAVTRVSQLEKAIDLWKLEHPGEHCEVFEEAGPGEICFLNIDFPCIEEHYSCDTRNFSYQADSNEIIAYSNGSHYYVLYVSMNTKQRTCGWFDSISKTVCDGLVTNGGWRSIENYDV